MSLVVTEDDRIVTHHYSTHAPVVIDVNDIVGAEARWGENDEPFVVLKLRGEDQEDVAVRSDFPGLIVAIAKVAAPIAIAILAALLHDLKKL